MNIWQILLVNGAIGILAQVLLIHIVIKNTADDVGKDKAEQTTDETISESLEYVAQESSKSKLKAVLYLLWMLSGIFAWEIILPFVYWVMMFGNNEKLHKKDKDS